MTITGYVFLFLTLVLAIVFPGLAHPWYEKNRDNQKAIVAEKAKLYGSYEGEKPKPGLLEEIDDLERKRAHFKRLVGLEERRRAAGEAEARLTRLAKDTELVFLRDSLADSEIRASSWRSALAQTDAEINARDAEIKEMDQAVQTDKAFGADLSKQVSDLKARLESAKTQMQKLKAELVEREKELAAIMKKQPDIDDDVASSSR
jgi:chromosome segregation ATPase